ncbi:MAG: hypothetical protein V1858_02155 [Candidatus Gottesmanbacteria bacterium]
MSTWLQNVLGRAVATAGEKFNLPEMGWSERITNNPVITKPYVQNPGGTYQTLMKPSNYVSPLANIGGSYPIAGGRPEVLGANTGGGGGGGAGDNNYNVPASIPGNPINNIDQGVSDYGKLIEEDYNIIMGGLSGQEQGIRSEAGISQEQIGNEFTGTMSQLGQEQATNVSGVESQLGTAETGAKSALQQARDLFRETQQSNIAQLSGLGISSSSVSEALAERLGVETNRRIFGISNSLQDIRQNATKELSRINNYFQERKTNLEKAKTLELSKIQQGLINGINQINTARNQAATDKARSRLELISNAKSSVDYINQQTDAFKKSLDDWNNQKTSVLKPLATDPQYAETIATNMQTLNTNYAPTGYKYVPQINGQGYITGYTLKKKEDAQAGTPGAIDYSNPNAWQ